MFSAAKLLSIFVPSKRMLAGSRFRDENGLFGVKSGCFRDEMLFLYRLSQLVWGAFLTQIGYAIADCSMLNDGRPIPRLVQSKSCEYA